MYDSHCVFKLGCPVRESSLCFTSGHLFFSLHASEIIFCRMMMKILKQYSLYNRLSLLKVYIMNVFPYFIPVCCTEKPVAKSSIVLEVKPVSAKVDNISCLIICYYF